MRQVKAGKPLIELIELCYVANRPILLVGKHGVGKSELAESAAKELDIQYICRDLSLMEPPDLVGLPKMEGGVTKYYPPSFLPTEGKGILAFEELNRCPTYMRSPCLQLLTARMLNDYKLPEGWLPMASINPADDKYDVHELDPALLSRFVKVHVVPDRLEWLAWAREKQLHESVIGYVDRDVKIFQDTCPRDWTAVSQLLKARDALKLTPTGRAAKSSTLLAALAGQVGRERASAFDAFLRGGPIIPEIFDVLKNFNANRDKVKAWASAGRTDIFDDYAFSLKTFFQSEDNYRNFRNQSALWIALRDFLKIIPPDQKEDILSFFSSKMYELPVS